MNADELKAILYAHKLWLESDGKKGERANLRRADLSRAYLSRADLSRAYLSDANLRGADLSRANLSEANLSDANLRVADLRVADLSGADLRVADLSGADLSGADLRRAYLRGANIIGVNIDYSAWPLWCGSAHVGVDARIAAQLAAHFCALDCDDPAYLAARAAILDFAKTSHRAKDLGLGI